MTFTFVYHLWKSIFDIVFINDSMGVCLSSIIIPGSWLSNVLTNFFLYCIKFLLFFSELYLLEVVFFLLSYIEFLLIENLYELVFFKLNLSFYLLNHFRFDVFLSQLMDI